VGEQNKKLCLPAGKSERQFSKVRWRFDRPPWFLEGQSPGKKIYEKTKKRGGCKLVKDDRRKRKLSQD